MPLQFHPTSSDYAIVCSTTPDDVSLRNPVNGSLIIDRMCDRLQKQPTEELMDLHRFLNQELNEMEKNVKEAGNLPLKVQIPIHINMRYKFRFAESEQ